MEAADSFQRQSAYPREEPKRYSGGSHTREINLLFRITALVISMINTVVNVSRQNCDSLWFFSKETRILMNAKQNYNGGRCGAINYSWNSLGWLNDFTVIFIYFKSHIHRDWNLVPSTPLWKYCRGPQHFGDSLPSIHVHPACPKSQPEPAVILETQVWP